MNSTKRTKLTKRGRRTKETKWANRIFVVVGNKLGEEYKGDEVDEKKKEMKGMKEITLTEESYEGDQIDNRYEGYRGQREQS